jgi:chemotaxis protein methyltransferase CheR
VNGEDLGFLCSLVQSQTGVVLDASKAYLFENRLSGMTRTEGAASMAELVSRLRGSGDPALQQRFIDCMLTKETSFFRDLLPFNALRSGILPELVEARKSERRLHIWSAACATGQEIFSVAIMIREHFQELLGWTLELRASDVSKEAVSRAVVGRYGSLEMNRGLPVTLLLKYFTQSQLEWTVRDEVRRLVGFFVLNLVRTWPPMPMCDLILLRNLLIYFDSASRRKVMARVTRQLRPGGYLMLGGAETTVDADLPLQPVFVDKALFFRRTPGPVEAE